MFHILLLCVQMDELACFAPGMLALGSFGYDTGEASKMLSLTEEVSLSIVVILFLYSFLVNIYIFFN